MITNSDLDLVARALDALALREAAAALAPATPCPDDDDRDGVQRDAM